METISYRKKYIEAISRSFLFKNIPEKDVEAFLKDSRALWKRFEKGEVLYCKADADHSLGIILSGSVSVLKPKPRGKAVVLNTLGVGETVGAASLFAAEEGFVADIVADRRCDVLMLEKDFVSDIMRRSGEIAENYIVFLSDSLHFLNKRMDELTGGEANIKIAEYLVKNAAEAEGVFTVDIPYSMTKLARFLNVGRASLYRAFDKYEKENIIARTGKVITILDIERLS